MNAIERWQGLATSITIDGPTPMRVYVEPDAAGNPIAIVWAIGKDSGIGGKDHEGEPSYLVTTCALSGEPRIEALLLVAMMFLQHEFLEFFKVGGKRLCNPHNIAKSDALLARLSVEPSPIDLDPESTTGAAREFVRAIGLEAQRSRLSGV